MQHEKTERMATDEDQQRYLVTGHNGPVKVKVKLEHPVRDGFWLSLGAFLVPVVIGIIAMVVVLTLWSGPAFAEHTDSHTPSEVQLAEVEAEVANGLITQREACQKSGAYQQAHGEACVGGASASASASAALEGVPQDCSNFLDVQTAREYGFECVEGPGAFLQPASASVSASASAPASQYQYGQEEPQKPSSAVSAAPVAAVLPETSGPPLLSVAGGALLIAGGLLARRLFR